MKTSGKYRFKFLKKLLFVIFLLLSAACQAADKQALEKAFIKTRYLLGAAYNVQNGQRSKPDKNIYDFVDKTKQLKQDIKSFQKGLNNLGIYALELSMVVGEINLCVSYLENDIRFCHDALSGLKNYYWNKDFGTDWSGYPVLKDWEGFPKDM